MGCTERTVEQRFEEHKENPESPICKNGDLADWKVKEVTKVYYFEKADLMKIETYYINIYCSKGIQLVNGQKVPKPLEVNVTEPKIFNNDQKFKIVDTGKFLSIRYTQGGKRFEKKKRYGKRCSAEEVMSTMQFERNQLLFLYA